MVLNYTLTATEWHLQVLPVLIKLHTICSLHFICAYSYRPSAKSQSSSSNNACIEYIIGLGSNVIFWLKSMFIWVIWHWSIPKHLLIHAFYSQWSFPLDAWSFNPINLIWQAFWQIKFWSYERQQHVKCFADGTSKLEGRCLPAHRFKKDCGQGSSGQRQSMQHGGAAEIPQLYTVIWQYINKQYKTTPAAVTITSFLFQKTSIAAITASASIQYCRKPWLLKPW